MSFWAEAIWIIRNLKKFMSENTEQILQKIDQSGTSKKNITIETARNSEEIQNPQEGVLYGFTDKLQGGN